MMSEIVLTISLILEILLSCHCARWSSSSELRCVSPLDRPRCELVSGWHYASFGVSVCSRGDCTVTGEGV